MISHYQGAGLALAAVTAWSSLSIEATETVLRRSLPPPIEGTGYVEGPVRAGGHAIVHWEIAKRTDCPGSVARVWAGENGFYMVEPLGNTAMPQSPAFVEYNIQTDIPELAPPGAISLTVVGEYTCVGSEPEPFTLGPVEMVVSE